MKIGILAPLRAPAATPQFVAALARGAQDAGASSIWPGEHVVLFPRADGRVGTPDGTLSLPAGSGLVDLVVVLSFLAALTQTVRLGTGVRILPQANPVYTAKELASLDWLSGGRVEFGVGVGSNPEEFAAVGAPYARRGARAEEYVSLIRALWRNEPAEHEGEFWRLPPCSLEPKPVQPGGPPVIVAGKSAAAIRRAARIGDGWYGIGQSPARLAELLGELDRACEAAGRDRAELRIILGAVGDPADPRSLDAYEELGVDEVLVPLGRQDLEGLDRTLAAVHALRSR
ncbi:MAG: TIGR03619 family F420-dependent LLM class oxidoreductase [Acidimicrobiales bacterium]